MRTFLVSVKTLTDAISSAQERGDDRSVLENSKDLDRFVKDNPQPGLSDAAVMAELVGINDAEDKPRRKFWRRK